MGVGVMAQRLEALPAFADHSVSQPSLVPGDLRPLLVSVGTARMWDILTQGSIYIYAVCGCMCIQCVCVVCICSV